MSNYEAWRLTHQDAEQAAREAYTTTEKLQAELNELREQMAAIGAGGVEPLRKTSDDASSLRHATQLLQRMLDAFGLDGHGGEFEDGECPLIDDVRAFLSANQAPCKPKQGMSAQDRLDAIRTHHMRVGKIICMASATSTSDSNFQTEDLINDLFTQIRGHHPSMAPLLKSLAALFDEGEEDTTAHLTQLAKEGFHGYAIEFNAPSEESGDDPVFGSYYHTWVYADTIDEAWRMGIEWAKKAKARVEMGYAA